MHRNRIDVLLKEEGTREGWSMPVVNQIGIESVTNVVRAGPQLTKVLRISSAAVFRGGITTGGHPEFLEITPGPVFIAKLVISRLAGELSGTVAWDLYMATTVVFM
jgi:hypothetical protein